MQLVLFSFYGSGDWDVVFMVWLCLNEQDNQILLNLTKINLLSGVSVYQ